MDRSLSKDHIAFGPETPRYNHQYAPKTHSSQSEHALPELKKAVKLERTRSCSVTPLARRSSTQHSGGSIRHEASSPGHDGRQHQTNSCASAQTSPRPYETPIFIPQGTQIDPNEPYFGKPPMTPPDSLSGSSTAASKESPSEHTVHVLPGTMAARNTRARTPVRRRPDFEERQKKATKAHRWGLVFKGMFSRSPVDETQLERVKGRHWTDE